MGFEDQIFPEFSSRAPRLQNLKVKARNYSPKQSWKLFDGDAPTLDTLELSECSVPWHSFNLKGLTTLILCNQFRQNIMEFLAMLSPLQDLTHLYIHRSLASATGFLSSTEFHTFQKISLPHLSRLLISAPLSTVIALLACVEVPLETKVGLDCNSEDDFTLSYSPVFSFLAQRMLSSLTFRSLVINSPMFDPRLTFSTLERDCDDFYPTSHQDWDCGIPLKIRIRLNSSPTHGNGDRILSDISSFVPLTNVQSVHVVTPQFSPASNFWRNMSKYLPDVRYIKLSDGFMPNLESTLSVTDLTAHEGAESQGGHADQDPDRILAPALEELVIHSIMFTGRPKSPCYADQMDLQSLFDVLATRKAPGGRLTITRCTEGGQHDPTPFDIDGLWKDGYFREVDRRSR
ncbi:hypothetical protein JVT61DRAFT_5974 [Boletus reticuloceps]|uniref:F-box protein n=1 Tax=Boletus reticuloceps TaxID=495285 RepID=A0A8I2YLA3_9AGAM|nr:hypothetical protein JVT61DRAFT_5974 [Boletus reticuloceps]